MQAPLPCTQLPGKNQQATTTKAPCCRLAFMHTSRVHADTQGSFWTSGSVTKPSILIFRSSTPATCPLFCPRAATSCPPYSPPRALPGLLPSCFTPWPWCPVSSHLPLTPMVAQRCEYELAATCTKTSCCTHECAELQGGVSMRSARVEVVMRAALDGTAHSVCHLFFGNNVRSLAMIEILGYHEEGLRFKI